MDTSNPSHLEAQLFIDGQWTDAETGHTMDIINPATGSVIGALAAASAADVDRAVQAGHRAFESGTWRDMPIQQRARILNRFADLFEADLEQFYSWRRSTTAGRSQRRARRFRVCRSSIAISRRSRSRGAVM